MKQRSTRLHAPKSQARAGTGRKEVVRGSGIYPASGPLPPGRAKVIPPAALGRRKPAAARQGSRAAIVGRTKAGGRTTAALARTLPKRAATHAAVAGKSIRYPYEIPRDDWEDFLNDFSNEHDGWTSEIQVLLPNQTARIAAQGLPLEGVSIDYKANECTAAVSAGTETADHLQRLVPRTKRITALNQDALEIAAADRTRTLLRCRRPRR
jgi:hypothetical protein